MIADDCCAFAAIAAKKVKTKLKLTPPNKAINKNFIAKSNGLPNNKVNARKLNRLINRTMIPLNIILETMNSLALTIEK